MTITIPVLVKDKALTSAAVDVLSARLRSLGHETFSLAIGDSIVFSLPATPPVDKAKVREALDARGSIAFLPMPMGAEAPVTGAPVPPGLLPLFDATGEVTSATVVDQAGTPAIEIHLGPAGTEALAAYSKDHIGEALVVALDGSVLFAPTLMEPITDGQLVVTLASDAKLPYSLDVLAAVLASGPMPAGWP